MNRRSVLKTAKLEESAREKTQKYRAQLSEEQLRRIRQRNEKNYNDMREEEEESASFNMVYVEGDFDSKNTKIEYSASEHDLSVVDLLETEQKSQDIPTKEAPTVLLHNDPFSSYFDRQKIKDTRTSRERKLVHESKSQPYDTKIHKESRRDDSFIDLTEPPQRSQDKLAKEAPSLLSNEDPLSLKIESIMNVEPPNVWSPLLKCDKKCHILIRENDQKRIFLSYWQVSTANSRFSFLYDALELSERPKSAHQYCTRLRSQSEHQFEIRFYLNTENGRQKVCKQCFLLILGEGNDSLDAVLQQKLLDVKEKKKQRISVNINKSEENLAVDCLKIEDDTTQSNSENATAESVNVAFLLASSVKPSLKVQQQRKGRKNIDISCNPPENSKSPKIWTPLPECFSGCHLLISKDNQKRIFDSYWKEGTPESRISFLRQMTKMEHGVQFGRHRYFAIYFLDTDEGRQEFCRNCFRNILNENNNCITSVLQEKMQETQRLSSDEKDSNTRIFRGNKPQKIWKPILKCLSECHLKITENDQKRIFNSYWKKATHYSRFSFLNDMIEIPYKIRKLSLKTLKKTRCISHFYLNTSEGRQKVCRRCFCTILSEPDNMITEILNQKLEALCKLKERKEKNLQTKRMRKSLESQLSEKTSSTSSAVDSPSSKTLTSSVSLPLCSRKCFLWISEEEKKRNFNSYQERATFQSKYEFIKERMEAISLYNPAHPNYESQKNKRLTVDYFLQTSKGRKKICTVCFRKIFKNSDYLIAAVFEDHYYEQGKAVEEHLKQFPLCESYHFNVQNSKKYLPIGLTTEIMYDLYTNELSNPLSLNLYRTIMELIDLNFKPKFLGKCEKCEMNLQKIRLSNDTEEKHEFKTVTSLHCVDACKAIKFKKQDESATFFNKSLIVCSFGFQQSLPTPFLTNAKAFYKCPLWTYNFTVEKISGPDKIKRSHKFYMWHEAQGGKTANEIASCLYQYLQYLPPEIKYVIFYSNSCCRESRSKALSKMFLHLLSNHKTLKMVEHKFLVDGHSKLEKDLGDVCIEEIMNYNRGKILQPQDWYNVFNKHLQTNNESGVVAMSPKKFYDFENLWKDPAKGDDSFFHENIKWLRYTKEGLVFYNESWTAKDRFQILNLVKQSELKFFDQLCNLSNVSITKKKKEDLLDIVKLVPFVNPEIKSFYEKLPTQETIQQTSFDSSLPTNNSMEIGEQINGNCIIKEEIDLGKEDLEVQVIEKDEGSEMEEESCLFSQYS